VSTCYYVLWFILSLPLELVLVLVFMLGIVFLVLSISGFWFWFFDVEFLFTFSCFVLFWCYRVALNLAACSVDVSYSCCHFSVLWDEYVKNQVLVMVWLSLNCAFCFLWLSTWNFYMGFMFTFLCYR
jgi:hypothetical protein